MIAPDTVTLIQAAQAGDKEACGRLVEENLGLIWSIVKRYTRKTVDNDDLYQLGCLGFLKAVQGFDTQFGTQFSTYAVPKIAGEIRRFLRDDGMVKVGRGRKEQALLIHRARTQLTAQLGREPVLSELAQVTGLTPEDIAAADLGKGGPAHRHQPAARAGAQAHFPALLQRIHPGQNRKGLGHQPGPGLPAGEKVHPVSPGGAQ